MMSHPRSLVCPTLALALGLAPSMPVLAATHASPEPEAAAEPAGDEVSEPSGDPEALSAEAVTHFQNKEYDRAITLFEQAYAIDPQPNYLFNIGRVYEEKGDLEAAVDHYQRFVSQPGVDLDSRQEANTRLKVLRDTLAQTKAEEQPPPNESTDEQTEPETTEPEITEDKGEDNSRQRGLRIAGYSLLGVGGAALVVGGVFGGLASGNAGDAEQEPLIDRRDDLRDTARTQARVADAMFITGGVLVIGGLVLVLSTVGKKRGSVGADTQARRGARTVWSPVVGRGHVGVGLQRRF